MGLIESNIMTKKFKVAFVGAGYMANEHLRAFKDIEEIELAGIFSRTKEKALELQTEFGISHVYDSIDEMYEKTEADMVIVTVTELSMNEISKQCFKHAWKVLLEKPAGYYYDDAADICNAAQVSGNDVFVAMNRRFYSSVSLAKIGLEEGSGPRFIKIQDQQDQKFCREYGFPEPVIENYMYANSIHQIDMIRHFGRGEVSAVNNVTSWDANNPGVVIAHIEFESGDLGLYEGIWNGPGPWSAAISTAEKRWELRPVESVTVQNYGERNQTSLDLDVCDTNFKPGIRKMAEHCLFALQQKKHTLTTIEDSLKSMKLVKQIFEL